MTTTSGYFYRLFGITVWMSDPLIGLVEAPPTTTPDVRFFLHEHPDGLELDSAAWQPQSRYPEPKYAPRPGRVHLSIRATADERFIQFRYEDYGAIVFDATGTTVWAWWRQYNDQMLTFNLTGPIFGFLLLLRGVTPLHASAVSYNDEAILFCGASGMGKSTTAAALTHHGCRLMTDDIATLYFIEGRFHLAPAHPRVRLLDNAVEALYGSELSGLPLTPDGRKRYFNINDGNVRAFEDRTLPIRRIFLLSGRGEHIERKPLAPRESLFILMHTIYSGHLASHAMLANMMRFLGRVTTETSIEGLIVPSRVDRLSEIIASL